jgi:molybdopterin synthase catalytic subunit
MPSLVLAEVTNSEISTSKLAELVADPRCGAYVTFSGDVRNHDGGKEVKSLMYEIHPSASEQIKAIAEEVIRKFSVEKVALAHRYGDNKIGETAFAVAVSAPHREAAFDACSALVNAVKEGLPIWKYQKFSDGSDEWVNCA